MRRAAGIAAAGLLAAAAASAGLSSPQAGGLAEVYNLRHYTHPNFTRIVVDIGVLREYAPFEDREAGLIRLVIYQARLNPILGEDTIPVKCAYIKSVRITQRNPSTVQVTAEVDFSRVRRYEVLHVLEPFRIVLDIYPGEAAPPAAGGAAGGPAGKTAAPETKPVIPQPAQPAGAGYSLARQLGLGVKTIVIDPGHGGSDPGCVDAAGTMEKDLALDISLRLRDLLKKTTDLDVILCRETDIYVPLENRIVVANQRKADIFLSVHINAMRKDKARSGVETFYLNVSPDPSTDEVVARENASTTKTIGQMDKILQKIVKNSKIIESRELAVMIQSNLVRYLTERFPDTKNLGTKGRPFWVLIGSEMPSVLVEVAHLSNAKEGQRLKDPAFRQRIAEGIANGLEAYLQSLGKG